MFSQAIFLVSAMFSQQHKKDMQGGRERGRACEEYTCIQRMQLREIGKLLKRSMQCRRLGLFLCNMAVQEKCKQRRGCRE